jgi:hypothetical protein
LALYETMHGCRLPAAGGERAQVVAMLHEYLAELATGVATA